MNKIILTPEAVADYNDRNKPAIISISTVAVTFNRPAQTLLQLKKGFHFGLEVDDNKLWYKDSTTGFEIKSQLVATLSAPMKGLRQMVIDSLGIPVPKDATKQPSLQYYIGELKNGRRELLLQNKFK